MSKFLKVTQNVDSYCRCYMYTWKPLPCRHYRSRSNGESPAFMYFKFCFDLYLLYVLNIGMLLLPLNYTSLLPTKRWINFWQQVGKVALYFHTSNWGNMKTVTTFYIKISKTTNMFLCWKEEKEPISPLFRSPTGSNTETYCIERGR